MQQNCSIILLVKYVVEFFYFLGRLNNFKVLFLKFSFYRCFQNQPFIVA